MHEPVTVACVQAEPVVLRREATLDRLDERTAEAASMGAQLVVFPEAFGLMGMVNILLTGLALFSDLGVSPSIVRSPRGEDAEFHATAWTLGILRGVVLFTLCWVLAKPYALAFGEPDLARLLPWAGITALLNGFGSTKTFLADRRLMQGRNVTIEYRWVGCNPRPTRTPALLVHHRTRVASFPERLGRERTLQWMARKMIESRLYERRPVKPTGFGESDVRNGCLLRVTGTSLLPDQLFQLVKKSVRTCRRKWDGGRMAAMATIEPGALGLWRTRL